MCPHRSVKFTPPESPAKGLPPSSLHQKRWLKVIATVVQADCDRLGVDPPIPTEDAAAMILAMDNGYLLGQLIEPGSYQPGTFARNITMLQSLFAASVTSPKRNASRT